MPKEASTLGPARLWGPIRRIRPAVWAPHFSWTPSHPLYLHFSIGFGQGTFKALCPLSPSHGLNGLQPFAVVNFGPLCVIQMGNRGRTTESAGSWWDLGCLGPGGAEPAGWMCWVKLWSTTSPTNLPWQWPTSDARGQQGSTKPLSKWFHFLKPSRTWGAKQRGQDPLGAASGAPI